MRARAFNTTDYRRCARRLRHAHRGNPARLARSLRELSAAYDAVSLARPSVSVQRVALDPARRFTQLVEEVLDGPTLLYSERLKLLRAARRLGVRRFDANLIIAAVQERREDGLPVATRSPGRGWACVLGWFVVIQGMIVAGAGYVLAG